MANGTPYYALPALPASPRRKTFQRRYCNGYSPTGRRTARCLPPREENFSRGGTVTGKSLTGRFTVRCLPCLPPRKENFLETPTGCRTMHCLTCLPPEEEKLFCTARCLPCLPPREEKVFHERQCNGVLRAACPACLKCEWAGLLAYRGTLKG